MWGRASMPPMLEKPIRALAEKQIRMPSIMRGVRGCRNRKRARMAPMAGHRALMGTTMEPAICRPTT